jgi:hypothetical protein
MKILLYKHGLLNLLTFQNIGMNSRITMVNGSVPSNQIWVLEYQNGYGKPLGQQMKIWMSVTL